LTSLIEKKKACGFAISPEDKILNKVAELADSLYHKAESLEGSLKDIDCGTESLSLACFYKCTVFRIMSELRTVTDELEQLVAKKHWPYPSYSKLLFSVF